MRGPVIKISGVKNGARGLTLVELAVAILVLSLGTLAALRTIDQSRHVIGGEETRLLAEQVALNRIEDIRLYGASARLPGTEAMGHHQFDVDTETRATAGGLLEVTVTVRSEQGPGARFVSYVSGRGAP